MNSNEHTSSSEDIARFASARPSACLPTWYPTLHNSISSRISQGQRRANLAVNQELVSTYWNVGHDILDRQSEQGWGSKVIDRLSADLRERFPRFNGFSRET